MKVEELIYILQKFDAKKEVQICIDGEWTGIFSIDDYDENSIEIEVK